MRPRRLSLLARVWTFYFAHRPWIVAGMFGYLVLLHLGAVLLVARTSVPARVAFELGLGSRWLEFNSAYTQKARVLRRLASGVDPGAVLFIGDSILASLDISALADHAVQLSIAGDTTRRIATRIDDYQPIHTARLVFLHVGINDLDFRRPEAIAGTMGQVLARIDAGMPVMMDAILPIDERRFSETSNRQVREANVILRRVCEARPRCRFVDTSAGLADASGNLNFNYEYDDGIHLNGAGIRVWKRNLMPVLAPWREQSDPLRDRFAATAAPF